MSSRKSLGYYLFREEAEVQNRLYSVTLTSLVNTVSPIPVFGRNIIKWHG